MEEAWVDIEWCVKDYPGEGSFIGLKKELGRHMEIQWLEGILHVGSGSGIESGSSGDEGSCTMVEGGCTKITEGSSPVVGPDDHGLSVEDMSLVATIERDGANYAETVRRQ